MGPAAIYGAIGLCASFRCMAAPAAKSASRTPGSDTARLGLPARLILYDNQCGFCDTSVQFVLDRDTERQFCFAALQGETASRLRAAEAAALPEDIDTLVYVDNTGTQPRILIRSRAIFAILGALYGSSRVLRLLEALPQGLSDLLYTCFAAMRYRLFGKLDSCRVPTPEERDRFLD